MNCCRYGVVSSHAVTMLSGFFHFKMIFCEIGKYIYCVVFGAPVNVTESLKLNDVHCHNLPLASFVYKIKLKFLFRSLSLFCGLSILISSHKLFHFYFIAQSIVFAGCFPFFLRWPRVVGRVWHGLSTFFSVFRSFLCIHAGLVIFLCANYPRFMVMPFFLLVRHYRRRCILKSNSGQTECY